MLELIAAEHLYHTYLTSDEGELTRLALSTDPAWILGAPEASSGQLAQAAGRVGLPTGSSVTE